MKLAAYLLLLLFVGIACISLAAEPPNDVEERRERSFRPRGVGPLLGVITILVALLLAYAVGVSVASFFYQSQSASTLDRLERLNRNTMNMLDRLEILNLNQSAALAFIVGVILNPDPLDMNRLSSPKNVLLPGSDGSMARSLLSSETSSPDEIPTVMTVAPSSPGPVNAPFDQLPFETEQEGSVRDTDFGSARPFGPFPTKTNPTKVAAPGVGLQIQRDQDYKAFAGPVPSQVEQSPFDPDQVPSVA